MRCAFTIFFALILSSGDWRQAIAKNSAVPAESTAQTGVSQEAPSTSGEDLADLDNILRSFDRTGSDIVLEDRAPRKALVIGISNYAHVDSIPNALNDASRVAEALDQLGFQVRTIPEDETQYDRLVRRIQEFGLSLEDGDFAIVYYSGHGFHASGQNWLVPVDSNDASGKQNIPLEFVIRSVAGEDNAERDVHGFIFLDACRTNQIAQPGFTALSREPSKVAVIYAAQRGYTAAGENDPDSLSVFTKYLIEKLREPWRSSSELMQQVSNAVKAETNRRQIPYQACAAGQLAGLDLNPNEDSLKSDLKLWIDSVSRYKKVNSVRDRTRFIQEYLDQRPLGTRSALARKILARIREIERESGLEQASTSGLFRKNSAVVMAVDSTKIAPAAGEDVDSPFVSVTEDVIALRKDTGTNSDIVSWLKKGDRAKLIDLDSEPDGMRGWAELQTASGLTGYVPVHEWENKKLIDYRKLTISLEYASSADVTGHNFRVAAVGKDRTRSVTLGEILQERSREILEASDIFAEINVSDFYGNVTSALDARSFAYSRSLRIRDLIEAHLFLGEDVIINIPRYEQFEHCARLPERDPDKPQVRRQSCNENYRIPETVTIYWKGEKKQ